MKILLLFLALLPLQAAIAQVTDTISNQQGVFQLGEITILGSTTDSINAVSIKKIEKFNRTDIASSLNLLPGITLANVGPRNESVVYVRGFDLRQVPVFIDGVPVYVPYDGYVDMGRFTTFDLSEINVSKGFSSILYGANTMGGAINLVSRKPVKKLELNGKIGAFSGDGYRWNLNAGSNLGKVYLQLGISQLKQDYYPMSNDFEARNYEDGGERDNAYRDDLKFSFKAGFTPNETDEYVIGYANQQGEKGTPPYIGDDENIRTRFWQWPKWNKQSLYFVSKTAIGNTHTLKTRWYYDTFVNDLYSYDDSTYSSMTRPYTFQSFYDDYTVGGNAEVESRAWANNVLKFAVQFKRDVHRENDLGEPQQGFIDNTISIGLEDTYSITPSLSVVPGLSYNTRNSLKAEDYDSDTGELIAFDASNNAALNAQLGVFWDINSNQILKASISRKTRFATIKDRYSYRMGQALPNPDLEAEVALNTDISYSAKFFDKLSVNASVFRSNINDIIQQVDNVEPGIYQLQNTGKALFYGYELNADYSIVKGLHAGANYSYIRRKNESNPEILFTNVPNHKLFGYVDYSFKELFNLLISTEYNSKRYSTSYGTSADPYTLFNTKASVKIAKYLSIESGVNNLFDKNYMLVEGFPEAGRNYFINLSFNTL
ncbi:MAG: TonB-dependent receptor [Thalassobius sp.]|nr:TonB-dependent receptor [Thalassovita sp.]